MMRSIAYIIDSLRSSLPHPVDMPVEDRRRAFMSQFDGWEQQLARPGSQGTMSATSTSSSPPLPHPSQDTVRRSMGGKAPVMSTAPQTSASLPPSQWEVNSMVKSSPNFNHVPRISAASLSANALLDRVREHERTGVPLIIEGWNKLPDWNYSLFSMDGFLADSTQIVDVRDIRRSVDIKMPLGELARHYEVMKLDQQNVPEDPTYYGKDIPCPDKWEEWLRSKLPSYLHPCGDNDMISLLDSKHRAETLMCYLGIGDTYTPAHKDPCGSFGHNLMCHTTGEGSAFWFMSARGVPQKDEPAAYFHDELGVELDLESHKATVDQFRAAPFDIYVAEQTLGDLVLVPPRSCHQVVNKGGITIKMSWSRMGLLSLDYSLHAELALYHRVCRLEIYRVKLTVFSAVKHYTKVLIDLDSFASSSASTSSTSGLTDSRLPVSSCRDPSPSIRPNSVESSSKAVVEVKETLTTLHGFLTEIVIEEWSPDHLTFTHISADGDLESHSCDFCGADIFQSFFACSKCSDGDDASEFICCPSCYVEGRSCKCGAESMEPRQSRPFDDLLLELNRAADALNKYKSPGLRIPYFNASTIKASLHLKTFQAACLLRDRILRINSRKGGTRCSIHNECPSHHAKSSDLLQCGKCKIGMCFLHILEFHNVHVAEALLASSSDEDHATWHNMHSLKSGKRKVSLNELHSRERDVPLSKRMAWAATKFRTCRPVDLKLRAKVGFYDTAEPVRLYEHIEVIGSEQALLQMEQNPKASTSKSTTLIIPQSPLTELSDLPPEDMMDESNEHASDDSDDDFVPVPSRRLSRKNRAPEDVVKAVHSPRKRPTVEPTPAVRPVQTARKTPAAAVKSVQSTRKAPTVDPVPAIKSRRSTRKAPTVDPISAVKSLQNTRRAVSVELPQSPPRTPSVKSILAVEPVAEMAMPPSIRPSRQAIPYVLLPHKGAKKRVFVPDSTILCIPKKKAKISSSGPTPAEESLATPESLANTRNECSTAAGPNIQAVPAASIVHVARSRTVVPLGSSKVSKPKPNHVRARPLVPCRELIPPRYGKPHRSVKRKAAMSHIVVSSRESSVSIPVPASSASSAQTQTAATPIVPDQTTTIVMLTKLLQAEQARSTELQKLYDKVRNSEISLNLQVVALKTHNNSSRAVEMRAEIARLKEELAEVQEENKGRERREQAYLLQIERSDREHIRVLEDREKQITNLKEQLQQSQATVLERNRSVDEFTHFTGFLGSSLAKAIGSNSNMPLQVVVPPYTTPGVVNVSPPTGPSWNKSRSLVLRGRGPVKRFMGRLPYTSHGPGEQGREYKSYDPPSPYWNAHDSRRPVDPIPFSDRNRGRGGWWMNRGGGTSTKRVIYERSPEPEGSTVGRQRDTVRYGSESVIGDPRRQWYRTDNSVRPWRDRYTESERGDDLRREQHSVTDSERGEGSQRYFTESLRGESSQRYFTESLRGEDSRRDRSDGDELSGDERREINTRSARSYSPVSCGLRDRPGDGGWASFRRDDIASPLRIETSRLPSPEQDYTQEPRSRHGSPDSRSFSESRRDEIVDDRFIEYQEEEMIESDGCGEETQREPSHIEELNIATLPESEENPWAS